MNIFQRNAALWLTEKNVYILKYEQALWRTIRFCQGFIHPVPADWGLDKAVADICEIYALHEYAVSCVIGGRELIWRPLDCTARNKAQAHQYALWEEHILPGYYFDIGKGKKKEDNSWQWFLAAYPQQYIWQLCAALQEKGNHVKRVDVLPAAVSQLGENVSGLLYIWDGTQIHCMELDAGIPVTYVCEEESSEEMENICIQECEPFIMLQEKTEPSSAWRPYPISPKKENFLRQWSLAPIFMPIIP